MRPVLRNLPFVALVSIAISSSSPAPADSSDNLLCIAIELVNPDLQPFRPAIGCIVGGGSLDFCASGTAKTALAANEDYQRIQEVYGLASSHQYSALAARFGTTAFCAAFSGVPGTSIVCNEFSQQLAAAGQYALDQTGAIVTPVANAALNWIAQHAGTFGCAIGFSCPRQANPNQYVVDLGPHGLFTIDKFDLSAIWQHDYAPRIGEGITVRLGDAERFKTMTAEVDITAPGTWLTHNTQLGWQTINGLTGQLSIEDRPLGLYPVAFAPFQKQLNARYSAIVNQAAADQVDSDATHFAQSSANWMQIMLPLKAEQQFDSALLPVARNSARRAVIADCRTGVDDRARALQHWGANGVRVGDTTQIDGKSAAQWAQIANWCDTTFAPAFTSELANRRSAFDQALQRGCARRANGAKGLDCPTPPANPLLRLASGMASCERAYKASAHAYCLQPGPSVVPRPEATPSPTPSPRPTLSPVRRLPGITPPAPSPSPSPTLSPRILRPGG